MAASPEPSVTPVGTSQPSYTSASTSSNPFPVIAIGVALVVAVGLGMTFALRPGLFGSLFGDRDGQLGGTSPDSCTVTAGLLNVRSGPGGEVVDTVKQGTNLSLTGNERKGWVEIRSPIKGWVFNESQYIDCTVASQTPARTTARQAPVDTPAAKPVAPKPKPVAPKPKPVDIGSDTLTKAADRSQDGDWQKAIDIAKSIPASSPAYQEAQAKIAQWQKELSETQAKFEKIQQAYNEGRWDEVIIAATDPKFFEQRYWRDKLNQLIEEAKKRKAEAEANQQQTPPESPVPEQPEPEPTASVNSLRKQPGEPPAIQ
jgi:serine/threonine-protein kinase